MVGDNRARFLRNVRSGTYKKWGIIREIHKMTMSGGRMYAKFRQFDQKKKGDFGCVRVRNVLL